MPIAWYPLSWLTWYPLVSRIMMVAASSIKNLIRYEKTKRLHK